MRWATLCVREVQACPGRALLTLLGLGLALALVVATPLTTASVARAYRDLFEGVAGEAVLEVTSTGVRGFEPGSLPERARRAGAIDVEPRIRGAAGLIGPAGGVAVAVVGVDPARAERYWPVQAGRGLVREDECLLDGGLARSVAAASGGMLRLWGPGGQLCLRLVGILQPRAVSTGTGGRLIVSLGTARRLLKLPAGRIHCLRLRGPAGGDLESLRRELSAQLPPGLVVEEVGARVGLARASLETTEQALEALGVLAVLAAGFVYLNLFLLTLTERRRRLALLRTLGATSGQVLRLLLAEALLLGLAGAALGCAAGTGLALLLQGVMGQFLGVALPPLEFAPGPYLLAGLLGPALAGGAAGWPAWQASRRVPLDDLLPGRDGSSGRSGWATAVAGLTLGLGAVPALGLCQGWLPVRTVQALLPAVLALLLGGGVLTLAALARPLLRLLGVLPLGLEGRLALAQLERRPGRTGLTAGVLFLGLAVTVGFEQALTGLIEDVRGWCRRSIVADFLVRGPMPDTAFVLTPGLRDSLAGELGVIDGVAGVERIAFVPARLEGRSVLVLARTFAADEALPLDLRQGDPGPVREGLKRGEVVLGAGLARRLGLGPGDGCTLQTPRGPAAVRVAGTAAEFAAGGEALYLEWRAARELLEVAEPHIFLVRARAGSAGTLRPRLETFCARRGLLLQSNAELRGHIDSLLGRLSGAVAVVMLLVFLVTSLGTASVLQRNVHEQAGLFALLQALGLRRRQVVRLVLGQALLLAWLGLLPGALAGQVVALVIGRAGTTAGLTVAVCPDAWLLAATCTLALGSAVLAALGPARGAARYSLAGLR